MSKFSISTQTLIKTIVGIGIILALLSGFIFYKTQGQSMTQIKLETNYGDILIELDEQNAPITSSNFKRYVQEGFYDNVIFHRVIKNFMIQGGGFEVGMKEKKTHEPILNEAKNGLKNDKYTIAMARTMDPHSASAQFFINTRNNDFLNHSSETMQGWGYAVFGRVIQGQETVDKIEVVKTKRHGFHDDVPTEDVIIKKATIVQ